MILFALLACKGDVVPQETALVDTVEDSEGPPETGETGDTQETGDTGPMPPWGLDERPVNATCLPFDRPIPQDGGFTLERLFPNLGFTQLTGAEQPPGDDSRWVVLEKEGIAWTWDTSDAGISEADVFVDLTDRLLAGGERGLLGLAFHPDFPTDDRVFVSYTHEDEDGALISRISSFQSSDFGASVDPDTESIVLELEQPAKNHNGGQIHFDTSGMLMIGFGDGGGSGVAWHARELDDLRGKLLRIDVDSALPYAIPADNPFLDADQPEIFAIGLRNPWGFAIDSANGEVWAGDVGNNNWEEVNRIEPGGDYGWPIFEGPECKQEEYCENPNIVGPLFFYGHEEGESVTGGRVYRGTEIPGLVGRFVFGDHVSGRIWASGFLDSGALITDVMMAETGMKISAMTEDADGELVIVEYHSNDSTLWKAVPTGEPVEDPFPTLLTETGCVALGDPMSPADGLIPYAPSAPFYSDGADKQRWFALPEGEVPAVDDRGDLILPVGSVTMKQFWLDGRPVETRIMVHHEDGWGGYTWEWNAEGTDATRVKGGKLTDEWRFPSEFRCAGCHTTAAGDTLGLELRQLAGDYEYPTGRISNQLETLAHIGIVSEDDALTWATPYPDPYDESEGDEDRVRAWLHTNCSHCHRDGAEDRFELRLDWDTPVGELGACEIAPVEGDLNLEDALVLAPGEPERSMLYLRPGRLDTWAMPPHANLTVDEVGLEVLERWIDGLEGCPE